MNEFDALSLIVDTAIKHGKHNQKLHGRRFGPDTGGGAGGRALAAPVDIDADFDALSPMGKHEKLLEDTRGVGWGIREVNALNDYSTDFHEEINGALKGRVEADPVIEKTIAVLDRAIERSPMARGVYVYRGNAVSDERLAELTKPGAVITSPAFLSTSTDRSVAEIFTSINLEEDERPNRVVMSIAVPAGTKAAYIPQAHEMTGLENTIGESELLLGRNAKLVVLGSRVENDGENDYTVIDMQVLP